MQLAETSVPTASHLAEAFREGSLAPSTVLERSIDTIARLDSVHRAVYVVDADDARDRAAASDARWRRGAQIGPLDGVPVTLKENTAKRGLPQSFGTAAGEPVLAAENGPPTDRLLDAGAVFVASTTMPDFSGIASGVSSRHGVARNAWNPAWNTGGSSSGAAVAAALGYAPINIGTDIGGSIRLPSAMNAVFGFKPSFGRIPIADSYLGRCAGPITRTVADAALAMQVLSLPDARDFTALPPSGIDWTQLGLDVRGLRVGVCLEPLAGKTTDPEIVDAVERAAALFASAGASVTATGPYLSADLIGTTLVRFLTAHLWAQMNDDRFVDDLASATPEFVQAVSASGSLSALDLMRAYDGIPQLVAETMTMLDAFDVVLSPTSSVLAGPAESCMLTEVAAAANFTSAFNATGTPAASINCGFSQDGRPIGLQVAAGRNLDLRVLQVAAWYEANRPAEACPDWPALDLATPNTARQAPTE